MQDFLFKMLLLFVFMGCPGGFAYAAHLHVILVGDFVSPDINQACRIDLNRMKEQALKIADYADLKLKMKQFAGRDPTAKRLLNEIESLRAGKNDVILFYFTGHGYRIAGDEGMPWPNLEFPVEHLGVSYENIIKKLSSKGAKLALIMADCCNHYIPVNGAPLLSHKALVDIQQKKENYIKLFCQTRGVIAIVSSRQGQSSYCTSKGSFYTQTFIDAFEAITSRKSDASWCDIFDGAEDSLQLMVKTYGVMQDPIVYAAIKEK